MKEIGCERVGREMENCGWRLAGGKRYGEKNSNLVVKESVRTEWLTK